MKPEREGYLLILGAALLWSTGGLGIKAIVEGPLVVAFYRSLIAFVVLVAFFRPRIEKVTPAFVIALVCYSATLITFVTATKWTTAANAIFIQYGGIVWILLLSPVVLKEHLHKRDVIAIAVALGGMTLFFAGRLEPRGMAGNLVALLSSFFFAIIVLALRLERDNGAGAAVTYGNILTAAVLFPFVRHDLAIAPRSAVILAFLGVFQIALAYVFFVKGLKYVPAARASLLGMVEPVMNPVWVFLMLGERPGPEAILGGLIVLGAVGWRTLQEN